MIRILLFLCVLNVATASLMRPSLGAGANHRWDKIHLISDLNGIGSVSIASELTDNTYVSLLGFKVTRGTAGQYTTTVPTGMTDCVDPVSDVQYSAGDTINIPRVISTPSWNWGNEAGTGKSTALNTAFDGWITIAYCDSSTTLYSIEIPLQATVNGGDTQFYWHLEAHYCPGESCVDSSNAISVEEINSNCATEMYKNSDSGTYGKCMDCVCSGTSSNLCTGLETSFNQATQCQGCACTPGKAVIDAKCAAVGSNWPRRCKYPDCSGYAAGSADRTACLAEDAAICTSAYCVDCECDGPGFIFDRADCDGEKTYNQWIQEKHEDVTGAVDPDGATETGGHCQICGCSQHGYYIDPAVCASASNGAYLDDATKGDGTYQAYIDSLCKPCSCGDKDRAAATESTYEGYYVSTKVGDCDGMWLSHSRGNLITGELKNSITTQPGSGVADNTYTGLTSIDDNSYASGAVFSVTLASGSATALTASTVGQNYVEGDVITISKTQFGTTACDITSGGRETDSTTCEAAASTWNDGGCSITTGGRGDSETHCEADAATWTKRTSAVSSTASTKIACPSNGLCVQGAMYIGGITQNTYVEDPYVAASKFSCEDIASNYATLTQEECQFQYSHLTINKIPSNNCAAFGNPSWCEAGSWGNWPKGCFTYGGNVYWAGVAGSSQSGSEYSSTQVGLCKALDCTPNAAGVCWPTGGASVVANEAFGTGEPISATTSFNLKGDWISTTISGAGYAGGTYTTTSGIEFTLAPSCSNTQYTTVTACTTAGTWTDASCDNTDYTTENACETQGNWVTSNVPANDLIITVGASDIQAGTATAPHSNVSPTAADAAGTGNDGHNTAVAGQIWSTTQDSTPVATYANNDGWCKKCACYASTLDSDTLDKVRDGTKTPVAGSYFNLNGCPAGKPQAAGGAGIRLDTTNEDSVASQTGKGWFDRRVAEGVARPAYDSCFFPATGTADDDHATAKTWDCTAAGKERISGQTDRDGQGFFIDSSVCTGSQGYLEQSTDPNNFDGILNAATACCNTCECSEGEYINANTGKCDGETVSASQPAGVCDSCSCAAGQYWDKSICDGNHPTKGASGGIETVGFCGSSCNPGFQAGADTASDGFGGTYTVPDDDDGRVCRDCSCASGDFIDVAACDGSTGYDSKRGDTDANRKSAYETIRTAVCDPCNCDVGGSIATDQELSGIVGGGLTVNNVGSQTIADVLVDGLPGVKLELSWNAAKDTIVSVKMTDANNNVFVKDQVLTTTNLVEKGGGGTEESPTGVLAEISLTVTHAVLNRADRTSIVDDLSYINTNNCNGFKKQNAPDNGGCTACSCTSKANSGEGWYIDANVCKGTAEFDDNAVTARDSYCKQCHTQCSAGQYVNTDVCDGTNANAQSKADGTFDAGTACVDCSCAAGNYIEARKSMFQYPTAATTVGSSTETTFTAKVATNEAVQHSCDGYYQYSKASNSGNGPPLACVDCTDLCTTPIQGTARYVDSSSGKCDGATIGLTSSTDPTGAPTVLSNNMPGGLDETNGGNVACGVCDCSEGSYIDMKYCNTNIVSATQPAASDRCNTCECASGEWMNYQDEEPSADVSDLTKERGFASSACDGTEVGTTDTGDNLGYRVKSGSQVNYDSTTPVANAATAPNLPSGGTDEAKERNGPITPYYCTTATTADACPSAHKITATTADKHLDTKCTALLEGEQCPSGTPVDCDGKCGGTSTACPAMYGYATGWQATNNEGDVNTCTHRCVKWKGHLRDAFREYLVTDVSNSAICALLRDSSALDLMSECCQAVPGDGQTQADAWTAACTADA